MSTSLPTRSNFLALSETRQHKRAADALRAAHETGQWGPYRQIEAYLALPPLPETFEALSDRYHTHLARAGLSLREPSLLSRHTDAPSAAPFLPYHVYLENLRSAHNVGSIFRTTEALRFGHLHLSPTTPTPENKKVRDAAMGTADLVPYSISTLSDLPRPLIALETTKEAHSLYDYPFPPAATLLLGNEEYGLSEEALRSADICLEIPLRGSKNSLNVANAYAIASAHISHQIALAHR